MLCLEAGVNHSGGSSQERSGLGAVRRDWTKALRKKSRAHVAWTCLSQVLPLKEGSGRTYPTMGKPCISLATPLVPVPSTACSTSHPWSCPCCFLLMQAVVLGSPRLGVHFLVNFLSLALGFSFLNLGKKYCLVMKWNESNIPLNHFMNFWQDSLRSAGADQSEVWWIVSIHSNWTEYGHPSGYSLKLSDIGEQMYFGKD